jgi:hypothetical protein
LSKKAWSNLGKFATVLGVVVGIYQLWQIAQSGQGRRR